MIRDILYSDDKLHRYKLRYTWGSEKKPIMFIMLNPSYTRPEGQLSSTTEKIIKYAKQNKYGSLYVGNLFSYITPTPYILFDATFPITTAENDIALKQMANESKRIIYAWGRWEFAKRRIVDVMETIVPGGDILYVNSDGSAAHPLSPNFKFKSQ